MRQRDTDAIPTTPPLITTPAHHHPKAFLARNAAEETSHVRPKTSRTMHRRMVWTRSPSAFETSMASIASAMPTSVVTDSAVQNTDAITDLSLGPSGCLPEHSYGVRSVNRAGV